MSPPARTRAVVVAPFPLRAAVVIYGLHLAVVWADAGYYTDGVVWVVRTLGAIPLIDDTLRRLGKRFLATPFFLDRWPRLRAPRTVAERCFAFLKLSDGLKDFHGKGLMAVWQDAPLVHSAMLAGLSSPTL